VGSGLDDLQPPPGVSWKKSKAKKKQQVIPDVLCVVALLKVKNEAFFANCLPMTVYYLIAILMMAAVTMLQVGCHVSGGAPRK